MWLLVFKDYGPRSFGVPLLFIRTWCQSVCIYIYVYRRVCKEDMKLMSGWHRNLGLRKLAAISP